MLYYFKCARMCIFSQCRSVESVYNLCVLVLAVFLFTVIRYEVSDGLVRATFNHIEDLT